MQHSQTYTKDATANKASPGHVLYPTPEQEDESDPEVPDYFRYFETGSSQNKCSESEGFWNCEGPNENEDIFNIVGQVVNSCGIQSDEEDNSRSASNLDQQPQSAKITSDKIEIDDVKVKSYKPRSKIMKKNYQMNAAKFKNVKESIGKSKLRKGQISTEKQAAQDMVAIAKTESKETFPNTSDGTLETKNNEQMDFTYPGPFCQASSTDQTEETKNQEDYMSKPKTKSQLSLKSKAYMRTGNIKNLHTSSDNSLENMRVVKPSYHRNSLPQRPDFNAHLYHYTPSTNYTILSSDEKQSMQKATLAPNMTMHPAVFGKVHKNSHETFPTVDKECLVPPSGYLNNTTPLPNMASFTRGVSYSPDFGMQQFQFYGMNTASSGQFSSNSDFMGVQMPPPYLDQNVGRSWPKIPQADIDQPESYPQVAQGVKYKGRMTSRDNEYKKKDFSLDLYKILHGKDTRTSLMIRNIPNKYSQTMLTQELDEKHKGLYDIVYLPIDPKNRCNCGYAFINVAHPIIILSLFMQFNGKSWRNFNSEKICQLTYARLQGKEPLLKQLEGSGVMQQSDPAKKPLILDIAEPSKELIEEIKEDFLRKYSNK